MTAATLDLACQNCDTVLFSCSICGMLRCRCFAAWSTDCRQHYDSDGDPYRLAAAMRYDDAVLADRLPPPRYIGSTK